MIHEVHGLVGWLNNNFPSQKFDFEPGNKFYKITTAPFGQKSVYAFIAMDNFENKKLGQVVQGDIFKPATWSQPAKHKRGTLYDQNTWVCFGKYSVQYL